MILLDNNFASIIQAIETGRLLSDNLKKVAIYLLPGGIFLILSVKYIFLPPCFF
jgi:sodium/potassium-transporting ATPase subunit alpha